MKAKKKSKIEEQQRANSTTVHRAAEVMGKYNDAEDETQVKVVIPSREGRSS